MKVKIRKDFCETDGFILGARDNLVITLTKEEVRLLQSRGFVVHLSYPASKIFIEREYK